MDRQTKTKFEIKEEESVDEDILCGIGSFKPQWLQRWATPKMYLLIFSIIGTVQGSYGAYLRSIISTLERRYTFTTKTSGSFLMIEEVMAGIIGIPIGYYGGKFHRPHFIGISMLIASLCSYISALPYLIYGIADHLVTTSTENQLNNELCNYQEELCEEDDRPLTLTVVLLLLLAGFLNGFGNIVFWAIGLSYMDDNSKNKDTPIYFALIFAFRLIGPILGYLLSAICLKYYENPFVDPGYGNEDPRWIGAWWIGFCVQGVLLTIFSMVIFLFPRRLPCHKRPEIKEPIDKGKTLTSSCQGLLKGLKRLFTNPVYILIIVRSLMDIYGTFGYFIMLPKYMENQFRLSTSNASLFSGPPDLTATIVAVIIGGFVMWKYAPSIELLIKGVIATELIGVILFLIMMIPRCPNFNLANSGLNKDGFILENECNLNCSCTSHSFSPVCDKNEKLTYFSACYAGCTQFEEVNGIKVYKNCFCVNNTSGDFEESSTLEGGFCVDNNCWTQALIYIIIAPLQSGIQNLFRATDIVLIFRSVNPEDKSLSFGTSEAILCLIGFTPFPLIFGALVDSVCLVWEKSCGESGNCWFYDTNKFSHLVHGISAGFTTLSAACMVFIYISRHRIRDLYKD